MNIQQKSTPKQRKENLSRILPRRLFLHRPSIKRILLQLFGLTVGLQSITVIILQAISVRRKHLQPQGAFPHQHLHPVQVGENTLQLYDYGRDLYNAMLAAIDAAQETIFLETYIWKGDVTGQTFKEHLARKAAQGVEVCIIYDSFANLVVPHTFKVFLSEMKVLKYHAIGSPLSIVDPRRYALDHRKLLIVDGHTGFIGGYNIGQLYASMWRDTHLRIQGPTVAHLAQSFISFWNEHKPVHEQIVTLPTSVRPAHQCTRNECTAIDLPHSGHVHPSH